MGQRESSLDSFGRAGSYAPRHETGPDVVAQLVRVLRQLTGDNLLTRTRIVQQIEISSFAPRQSEKHEPGLFRLRGEKVVDHAQLKSFADVGEHRRPLVGHERAYLGDLLGSALFLDALAQHGPRSVSE